MMATTTITRNRSLRPAHPRNDSEQTPDLDLARQPKDGASDWEAGQRDTLQYSRADLFRVDADRTDHDRDTGSPFNPARTSFKISEATNPANDPNLWSRLKRKQHDTGGDYSEHDRKKATMRRDEYYRRYDAILQSLEVSKPVRQWALKRALRTDISGFNAHYNGYHGAVLGFALLALTDDLDEALTSPWFDRMETLIDELPDADVNLDPESLVQYVFENYGDSRGEA